MEKRLYKNTDNKMISGVLAGFADYLGIDATVLRIGYVLLSIVMEGFPGLILYIVLAIVMPEMNAEDRQRKAYNKENAYRNTDTSYGSKPYTDADYKETTDSTEPDSKYKKSGGSYTPDDRE